MARSYDVKTCALATQSTPKWVDNLLCQHTLPGVMRWKQGVGRRISDDGVLAIELTATLNTRLGVPLARAAEVARVALGAPRNQPVPVSVAPGMTLVLDLPLIERRLRDQIIVAMESVAHVRRGRPRRAESS